MAVRCGIDLGTTYSSVSYFDTYNNNNRVDTVDLETADGSNIIRSVVYYPGGGQPPVVGETAWNAAKQWPERVIVGIKRSMGTDFKTAPIDGVEYTPAQVSAEILKVVARDAQAYIGQEVKDVVITVPAWFGENQRAATLEAGQIAGLNVLELLSEPQAAALAFAVENVAEILGMYLLVYDLGGGTFDVTLTHTTLKTDAENAPNLNIDTLCKDGNASLGGLDWDRALAEIVADKVMQAHGVDIRLDPKNDAILLDNCEKAKRHLGRTSSVSIVADLANHQAEVTVSEFEDHTRDLLLQTQMLLEKVIEDAERVHKIPKDKIQAMLTGGSSKMPMVKRMIEGVLGRPPMQRKNPELLVTIGAAYRAHLLQPGTKIITEVPKAEGGCEVKPVGIAPGGITDIAAHSVGVEIVRPAGQGQWARFNSVILPTGVPYEKEFKKMFRTAEDDMTEIPIVLYKSQYDTPNISECERLMVFTITGLPPGRPAGQEVEVTLRYDSSGILRGTAIDVATQKACEIVVDRSKTVA